MPRSTLASLLLAVVSVVSAAACVEESQTPPPVNAPTTATPTASPVTAPDASAASTTPPATGDAASPSAEVEPDASAPSQAAPGTPLGAVDGGAPAQFRACRLDSDCVAVPRAGCCRNGWLEAVAVSEKDAYAKAEKCSEPHPICPMYIVQDKRVALCDNGTHLCTMTPPDQVSCGGFIRNQHHCPAGYRCKAPKMPDVGGKCVQQP